MNIPADKMSHVRLYHYPKLLKKWTRFRKGWS